MRSVAEKLRECVLEGSLTLEEAAVELFEACLCCEYPSE